MSTKVCSNRFAAVPRYDQRTTQTLSLKGYSHLKKQEKEIAQQKKIICS